MSSKEEIFDIFESVEIFSAGDVSVVGLRERESFYKGRIIVIFFDKAKNLGYEATVADCCRSVTASVNTEGTQWFVYVDKVTEGEETDPVLEIGEL